MAVRTALEARSKPGSVQRQFGSVVWDPAFAYGSDRTWNVVAAVLDPTPLAVEAGVPVTVWTTTNG